MSAASITGAGAVITAGLLVAGATWAVLGRKLRAAKATASESSKPSISLEKIKRILMLTQRTTQMTMSQAMMAGRQMHAQGAPQQVIEQQIMQMLASALKNNDDSLFKREGVTDADVIVAVKYWSAKDKQVMALAEAIKAALGQFFRVPAEIPEGMTAEKFLALYTELMNLQIELMYKMAEVVKKSAGKDMVKYRKEMQAMMAPKAEALKTQFLQDRGITESSLNACANHFAQNPSVRMALQQLLQKQAAAAKSVGMDLDTGA